MTDLAPPPAPPVRRRFPVWLIVVIPIIVVTVIGLLILDAWVGSNHRFQSALEECSLGDNEFAQLGDGGRTLQLNSGGADSGGLSSGQVSCVLEQLNATDAVIAAMNSTRALDGRVTGSWDGVDAVWTYHPDNGLDLVLTLQ